MENVALFFIKPVNTWKIYSSLSHINNIIQVKEVKEADIREFYL